MKLNTNIESLEATVSDGKLVVWSKNPLRILSSAVLNGGLREANGIMSVQVSKNSGEDEEIHKAPEDFLRKEAAKLNLPPDNVVGIMTAADLQNVAVKSLRFDNTNLCAVVTAGTHFSATAGDEIASKRSIIQITKAGTINVIVLIDGNLTASCMVGCVNTIAEAKASALRELDIRSRFSKDLATGTITDSVVVACTKQGQTIRYAGTATVLGELIGKTVRESVKEAVYKQENISPSRLLTKRLEERGISIDEFMSEFSKAHAPINESKERRNRFKEGVQQVLIDNNIASLVIASLRLDEDIKVGLAPSSGPLALEILQKTVVELLAKRKGASVKCRLNDSSLTLTKSAYPSTRSVLFAIMNYVYSSMP